MPDNTTVTFPSNINVSRYTNRDDFIISAAVLNMAFSDLSKVEKLDEYAAVCCAAAEKLYKALKTLGYITY